MRQITRLHDRILKQLYQFTRGIGLGADSNFPNHHAMSWRRKSSREILAKSVANLGQSGAVRPR